jgi:hypothetical protein
MSVRPLPSTPEHPGAAPAKASPLRPLVFLAVGVVSLLAYQGVGRTYYLDFAVPQGSGMYSLLPEEMTHYGMFTVFGLIVAFSIAVAIGGTSVATALVSFWRALAGHGWVAAVALAIGVALACGAISRFVLDHAVTCDDEHAYRFIAQTLLSGSLVAPSPGTDLEFFREQFIVLTPTARYGKYPIGHPLLLAGAMALRAEAFVVPLVTGLVAAAVYAIGLRMFGPATAAVAAALFVVSPQVLLTGATLLSQPLCALCACGATLCLLYAQEARRKAGWFLGAGACLGYGILTRPLPGLLFAGLAAAYVALDRNASSSLRTRLAHLAALAFPLSITGALMMLVNVAQASDPLASGHAAMAGSGSVMALTLGTFPQRASSLVGSAIRANFWLFGWPLSLAFCVFARGPRVVLLWGVVGAELAYRLISPKVGVGGTGPIYLYEAVPALCLLTAHGLRQIVRRGTVPFLRDACQAAAAMLALGVVSLAMFLPPKLQDLRRMGEAQLAVHRLVARHGVRHALVFHETVVPYWTRLSWAYFPPTNSPSLDDDVLFIALQRQGGLAANAEFWRRRFPDRTAWYFGYLDGRPALVPLTDLAERATRDPVGLPPPP